MNVVNRRVKYLVKPVVLGMTRLKRSVLIGLLIAFLANCGGTDKLPKPMSVGSLSPEALGVNENGKGLPVDYQLESVTVLDISGNPYPLSNAWAKKPALIVFYRGGWCPYCNMQVRELSQRYQEIAATGVQAVLISVDAPEQSALMDATYEVPFPVLSDQDLVAHQLFNVVLKLDKKTLLLHKAFGINASEWSQREHKSVAVASVFVVDTSGKVAISHALEDITLRPSIEQLIQLIEMSGVGKP